MLALALGLMSRIKELKYFIHSHNGKSLSGDFSSSAPVCGGVLIVSEAVVQIEKNIAGTRWIYLYVAAFVELHGERILDVTKVRRGRLPAPLAGLGESCLCHVGEAGAVIKQLFNLADAGAVKEREKRGRGRG